MISSRLVIYFLYDKDGIVDNYVLYMLDNIKKNVSRLIVVSNGDIVSESKDRLKKYTEDILIRENKGFDVWAYKYAMETIGWDDLEKFDEVIMMNSTIMGPLFPFENMFEEMDKKELDFWGITTYNEIPFDPFGKIEYGYIPLHLQSHFIAVRKSLISSIEFREYWNSMKEVNSYDDAISYHEAVFTKKFSDLGFNWDSYVQTRDFEKYSDNPLLMYPVKLIEEQKCPIFKRRSFFHNYDDFLSKGNGAQSINLFNYLKEKGIYDVDLIIQNIIRTQNMDDIRKCLNLYYILSDEQRNTRNDKLRYKTALILHCYFFDLIEYCYNYACSMPNTSDIYVTTDTLEKKEEILKVFDSNRFNKLEVIIIENRGRDVSALLVGTKKIIMNYDLVCFAHDKKVNQLYPKIKGEEFSYRCFENILKNEIYVDNIIDLFKRESKLGMLMPPPPYHADYYPTIGFEWGYNYDATVDLAKKIGLTVDISQDKTPIAPLGTMFWFRPQALEILFAQNWEYVDFPKEPNNSDGTLLHAIERIYPFVVQQHNYYPAWLVNDSFAKTELINLYYMLSKLNKVAFQIYGFNSHYGLISTMKYSLNNKGVSYNESVILKKIIKNKLRKVMHPKIWRLISKVYRKLGGKRWID